jgi:hypothetical protein
MQHFSCRDYPLCSYAQMVGVQPVQDSRGPWNNTFVRCAGGEEICNDIIAYVLFFVLPSQFPPPQQYSSHRLVPSDAPAAAKAPIDALPTQYTLSLERTYLLSRGSSLLDLQFFLSFSVRSPQTGWTERASAQTALWYATTRAAQFFRGLSTPNLQKAIHELFEGKRIARTHKHSKSRVREGVERERGN